jgi:hypothetical protein
LILLDRQLYFPRQAFLTVWFVPFTAALVF